MSERDLDLPLVIQVPWKPCAGAIITRGPDRDIPTTCPSCGRPLDFDPVTERLMHSVVEVLSIEEIRERYPHV